MLNFLFLFKFLSIFIDKDLIELLINKGLFMKKEHISHFFTYVTSLIVFFTAFQFFCFILVQPHKAYAQRPSPVNT